MAVAVVFAEAREYEQMTRALRRGRVAQATTTRTGGERQIPYNGHPLYRYARDAGLLLTFGQGLKKFGARWRVLSASGKAPARRGPSSETAGSHA